MAELTDAQVDMLQLLDRGPLLQGNPLARARWEVLRGLEQDGLVRRIRGADKWAITDQGRVALVSVDGRPRLTIEPPRRRRRGRADRDG